MRTLSLIAWSALLAAGHALAQTPPDASEVESIEDLVAYVAAREASVRNVVLRMRTRGTFPDGTTFSTAGTLRVLGGTHFHATMRSTFGDDLEAETETVRTPDGLWMRERDPVQGEVYLHMDRELMERLESASRAIGGDASFPGSDGRAQQPLGSRMLEELAKQFALEVDGPKPIDGARSWVVKGALRADAEAEAPEFGLGADSVDLIVRVADGAVVGMTQFRRGQPIVEVTLEDLKLDPPLEASTFRLDVPERTPVLDVLDHPPHAAQIERLLEEARDAGWQDPASSESGASDTSDTGRDGGR